MSLLDQVISDAKKNNIIKDEIPIVSPSLNPTDKTNYPDSWEKISNREYQEETDFMQKVDFAVDLKKDTSELIDETVIDQINEAFSPKDLRQAQETGRLIHNWWIYYLKSLKKFINHSFDDSIRNFHYNYANKAIEFGKLYNKPTLENPSCIINLDSFTPDGNIDPIRRNSGFFSILQSLELAINKTNKEVIYCDFKFVNLQQTIMINFNSSTDILNYYDRLTTVYPINHDFESYQFRSLINVHSVTEGWGLDDDIHGIVWDVSALGNDHHAGPNTKDKLVQRWGEYYCTPRFTIQSVNPLIDKQSEKYQLTIGLNTFIRVPQTIFGYYNQYIGIKAIEVILDIGTGASPFKEDKRPNSKTTKDGVEDTEPIYDTDDKPIMMDIDRDIYDSYRIKNSYYLSYTNISTTGKLILPKALLGTIQDQAAAIYMNTDSTSVSAELYWLELGYLYHQDQVNFGKDVLQNKIDTQVLTRDQLLEIGIEIDEGIEQIEVLIINIPNFEQVKKHFEDKSIWFNLRLFTFDTTSDLPLK